VLSNENGTFFHFLYASLYAATISSHLLLFINIDNKAHNTFTSVVLNGVFVMRTFFAYVMGIGT